MNRIAMCLILGMAATRADAHFPYLIPDGPSRGKAVFSDRLKPDDQGVPVDKIAGTKLAVLAGGKHGELSWTLDKAGNFYSFEVPGDGTRVAYGTTNYGVLQRGDSKPFSLRYYSKLVLGPASTPEQTTIGKAVPLELVPVVEGGKLRLLVLAGGKPLPKAEVSVMIPGEEKPSTAVTDSDGRTTPFEAKGLYGAQVRLVEVQAGEEAGKKFEEIRHYATLTVTLGDR